MIWVEILSRYRDVAARFRVDGDEAHIGRGYDNDVIVDDPYVAARHVRVFRDEAGRLIAEDAGSKNGLFLDRGDAPQARIVIDPEHPVRIGQTCVRIRDATYAVPTERVTGARPQTWPAVVAAVLAAAALGFGALSIWLEQTGEPRASTYLYSLLFGAVLALSWVSIWALMSRIFSGQARFLQNFLIAISGLLALALSNQFSQIAAFAFSWPGVISYHYVVQSCIVAVVCFFHLRETGRSHLALKGAAVAALLAIAVAAQTVVQSESVTDFGRQVTVRRLMPPSLRIAPVRAEGDFFAEIGRLKAVLDGDRIRAQADSREAPGH